MNGQPFANARFAWLQMLQAHLFVACMIERAIPLVASAFSITEAATRRDASHARQPEARPRAERGDAIGNFAQQARRHTAAPRQCRNLRQGPFRRRPTWTQPSTTSLKLLRCTRIESPSSVAVSIHIHRPRAASPDRVYFRPGV